jgi:hypothetical protein
MSLYHVTDEVWVEKILREGLVGNPVVYLARSYFDALSIRRIDILPGLQAGDSCSAPSPS